MREQVEVLALDGDIAVHGSACGGHLLSARVRPTLEVILTESPAHLRRVHDPRSGLALISL